MSITLRKECWYKNRLDEDVYCLGEDPRTSSNDGDDFICITYKKSGFPKLELFFENGNWMTEEYEEDEEYDQDIIENKD